MSATGSLITVEVPDIGDYDEVPVIELLVSPGDTVAVDDPLVTLESDKATMDVPSPAAGVVRELKVSVGDKVSQGTAVLTLEPAGDGGAATPTAPDVPESDSPDAVAAAPAPPAPAAPEAAPPAPAPPEAAPPARAQTAPAAEAAGAPPAEANGGGPIYASPSVRRLARELGVDLRRVAGTCRKGRITPDDVRRGESAPAGGAPSAPGAPGAGIPGLALAPWPKVDFEKFGPVERVQRSRIQKISAPNLARNWVMIPHVTHNDEADITELEAWRKQLNDEYARREVKFTMVTFLVAACVATLKEFPDFNASLDGDELVRRLYYNIGFAADTPGGLVVPVIKDADRKSLVEIAGDLTELSGKARAGKLSPGDMSGGTFTISSLGGIGGTSFSPIINAPELAILGVTRSAMKPVWNGKEFVPRLMVPLSLSYDHRVIDGAAAARFTAHLVQVLGDLRRVLL